MIDEYLLYGLYDQLKIDEGVIYEIYKDSRNFKTFGIGHLIKQEDEEWLLPVGTPVSKDRVYKCFKEDVMHAILDCRYLYPDLQEWPLTVQEVVINMRFNLGFSGLKSFKKFKIALEVQDWKQAAIEGRDSLWYEQVMSRAERLMSRLEQI